MKKNKGQAILPLLIIIVLFLSLGTAAIELAISNILISQSTFKGLVVYYQAESAFENGLLMLLRNPNYSGEGLQIGDSSCTINVTGESPRIISAECDNGQQIRKIQAEASFIAGEMLVENIQETE